MGKRIAVLNGSPRRNGNTSALVRAFMEGAAGSGSSVREFFLCGLGIKGCRGCFGGQSGRDCPCVQKDGMEGICAAVRDSDIVVMASPLYYWSISGQLKTAIDRLFALEEGGENLLRGHARAGVLLMAAEGDEFDDAVMYFDHLMGHLGWKNLGHVLAGGNLNAGDIEGKPELRQAYELGKSVG